MAEEFAPSKVLVTLGWKLMGYPCELPFWRHIYRLGARICDKATAR